MLTGHSPEEIRRHIGRALEASERETVDQAMTERLVDATRGHQGSHVDVEGQDDPALITGLASVPYA